MSRCRADDIVREAPSARMKQVHKGKLQAFGEIEAKWLRRLIKLKLEAYESLSARCFLVV